MRDKVSDDNIRDYESICILDHLSLARIFACFLDTVQDFYDISDKIFSNECAEVVNKAVFLPQNTPIFCFKISSMEASGGIGIVYFATSHKRLFFNDMRTLLHKCGKYVLLRWNTEVDRKIDCEINLSNTIKSLR